MAESKTLGDAILVPQVYTALNTRYILVTEWVEGVKVRARRKNTWKKKKVARPPHLFLFCVCSQWP